MIERPWGGLGRTRPRAKNPVDDGASTWVSPESLDDEVLDEVGKEIAVYAVVSAAGLAAAVGLYLLFRWYYPVGVVEFNNERWQLHESDKIWAARMVLGESGDNDMTAGAAVLWAVAQRWVTKSALQRMNFTEVMRSFSQPLNPIWSSSSASGCQRSPSQCSAAALARRQSIQSTQWWGIPSSIRGLVEDFFKGRVSNPVPGYNNFAAAGYVNTSASELPAITIGGNTFVRDPGSIPGIVRIV